jgi:acyl carrier protein
VGILAEERNRESGMTVRKLGFEEFQAVVSEFLGIDPKDIRRESSIYQDIGIDSLGLVNLGVKIQKKFNIAIPAAAVIEIRTAGELYEAIRGLVEGPAGDAPTQSVELQP